MILRPLVAAILVLSYFAVAKASEVRDIDWPALLSPEAAGLREQMREARLDLQDLPQAEFRALRHIAKERHIRRMIAEGALTEAKLRPRQKKVLDESPSAKYPDAAAQWGKLEDLKAGMDTLKEATNQGLNGRRVEISGYLLPLNQKPGLVTEFLLVPFVGACIHVPPPPANQIVQVVVPAGFETKSIYEPVTVTGTLQIDRGQSDLYLIDGNAMIDHSYRMSAELVVAEGGTPTQAKRSGLLSDDHYQ